MPLDNTIYALMVKMNVVQIVGVITTPDNGVTTVGSMLVIVIGVGFASVFAQALPNRFLFLTTN